MSAPSLIGIRATWKCAACRAQETTYQLIRADEATPALDLPRGWRRMNGQTFCPAKSRGEYDALKEGTV